MDFFKSLSRSYSSILDDVKDETAEAKAARMEKIKETKENFKMSIHMSRNYSDPTITLNLYKYGMFTDRLKDLRVLIVEENEKIGKISLFRTRSYENEGSVITINKDKNDVKLVLLMICEKIKDFFMKFEYNQKLDEKNNETYLEIHKKAEEQKKSLDNEEAGPSDEPMEINEDSVITKKCNTYMIDCPNCKSRMFLYIYGMGVFSVSKCLLKVIKKSTKKGALELIFYEEDEKITNFEVDLGDDAKNDIFYESLASFIDNFYVLNEENNKKRMKEEEAKKCESVNMIISRLITKYLDDRKLPTPGLMDSDTINSEHVLQQIKKYSSTHKTEEELVDEENIEKLETDLYMSLPD